MGKNFYRTCFSAAMLILNHFYSMEKIYCYVSMLGMFASSYYSSINPETDDTLSGLGDVIDSSLNATACGVAAIVFFILFIVNIFKNTKI